MQTTMRYIRLILTAVLGLALIVGVYVFTSKQNLRWDLTSNKRNSLSAETETALATVNSTITAVAFYLPNTPGKEATQDLFDLFKHQNDNFSYEFVDPDRAPYRAKELGVTVSGTVVLLNGDRRESVSPVTEENLINAVIKVSDARERALYILTGHGELVEQGGQQSLSALKQRLTEQGVAVEPLTLAREQNPPTPDSVILIAGPRRDLLDHELELLGKHLDQGGRLFVAFSAEDKTNLDDFVAKRLGIRRLDGLVIDMVSRMIAGDPTMPMMQQYAQHPLTRDFSMMTFFPTSCALAKAEDVDTGGTTTLLGATTDQAWLETDLAAMAQGKAGLDPASDTPGPLWLTAAWEANATPDGNGAKARAVVFADQDILSDQYVNAVGNMDFARNAVNWLLEREGLIVLNKKSEENVYLMLESWQRALLTYGPLVGLPILAVLLAILVALWRRPRNIHS